MTSKPNFITERLSVVCTWSGLPAIKESNMKVPSPQIEKIHPEKRLLKTFTEMSETNSTRYAGESSV